MTSNVPRKLRNVSFKQLQVFKSIATTGSFTAAARELYLTQPSVSTQMKKLEDAIGTPLFEQVGRRMHLTDCGHQLSNACEDLFKTLEQFETYVAGRQGIAGGTLTFAGVTTTEYFAPVLLGVFGSRYPEVNVSLSIVDRGTLLYRMQNNRDDLYLIDQLPDDIELVTIPFLENPLVVVSNPTHRLAHRKKIDIRELQDENFLLREEGSGTRIALKRFLIGQNITLKVAMQLSSNEALKRAVSSGMGLSILSKYAVAQECNRKDLTILDVTGFPLIDHWYIVHSKDKHMPPAGSAFLRFLHEEGKSIVQLLLLNNRN